MVWRHGGISVAEATFAPELLMLYDLVNWDSWGPADGRVPVDRRAAGARQAPAMAHPGNRLSGICPAFVRHLSGICLRR